VENKPKHHPKKRRNRHHILYPRSAWQQAGPTGLILRGVFIVRINSETHSKLHFEIDPLIGESIQREKLPSKRTLRHLKKEFYRNENQIRRMNAFEKIDWLNNHLDSERDTNSWLKALLFYEEDFLERHKEELT
jgi:hypothetical protein